MKFHGSTAFNFLKDSRYQIGKCSANVGQKRRGREEAETAKLLILLVELTGIEPVTS